MSTTRTTRKTFQSSGKRTPHRRTFVLPVCLLLLMLLTLSSAPLMAGPHQHHRCWRGTRIELSSSTPSTAPNLVSPASAPPSSPGCYAGTSHGPTWSWHSVPCASAGSRAGPYQHPLLPRVVPIQGCRPGALAFGSQSTPLVYDAYLSITFSQFSRRVRSGERAGRVQHAAQHEPVREPQRSGEGVQFVEQNTAGRHARVWDVLRSRVAGEPGSRVTGVTQRDIILHVWEPRSRRSPPH